MDNCWPAEHFPQEKAMHNLLIFDCIISKMGLNGLKNARLVCKSWQLAASSELVKRPQNKLGFEWNDMPNGHQLQQKHEGKTGNQPKLLSDLNVILKTSETFPCRFFSFKRGWMAGPIFKNFFHFQGKQIETLIMNEVDINPDTFMHMVNEELPNLKKLFFNPRCSDDHWTTWSSMHDRNIEFKLPSLEILHLRYSCFNFACYKPFVKEMIAGAPKLKSLGDLSICYIVRDLPKDKIRLIKECSLPFHGGDLEDVKRFINLKPQLTILNVVVSAVKVPYERLMVSQLLQTCSDTLIRLWTNSLYLVPIEVEMKSLTHLTVHHLKGDENFPASVLANFCPRLKFIWLKLNRLEEYFKVVGESVSLTSVKNVAYTGTFRGSSPAFYSAINCLFPNLTKFSMDCYDATTARDVSAMFERLYKLKEIHFRPNKRVSREEWLVAILNREAEFLLKLILDTQRDSRHRGECPWEEPQLFSI